MHFWGRNIRVMCQRNVNNITFFLIYIFLNKKRKRSWITQKLVGLPGITLIAGVMLSMCLTLDSLLTSLQEDNEIEVVCFVFSVSEVDLNAILL